MPVTKRTRYEVLKRDNHTCRYCGATAPDAIITIDHVVPIALGGTDDPGNLVTACRDCNYGKSSSAPDAALVEDVSQDALRWAAAMKLAAERVAAKDDQLYEYVARVETELEMYGGAGVLGFPYTWRDSAEKFYRAGLPVERLNHAIAISLTRASVTQSGRFRYVCGIAWSMIREIQAEAERIVAEGDVDAT